MRTTTVHLKEARGNGGTGWKGAKGENWDNCNSIINKIYFLYDLQSINKIYFLKEEFHTKQIFIYDIQVLLNFHIMETILYDFWSMNLKVWLVWLSCLGPFLWRGGPRYGSVPLGCVPKRQPINVSHTSVFLFLSFSLPCPLSKDKQLKNFKNILKSFLLYSFFYKVLTHGENLS